MENENIIQTVSAIFSGADEHNWPKVQNAMAESVLLDYASLSGNPAATLSSKDIIESWKGFLPGFDKTHHQLSNFKVAQKNNITAVRCDGKADHFIGKEVWTVEGNYEAELSKENNYWVVTKLEFNCSKQSGNLNLPALAVENIKNKKLQEGGG